MKLDQIVFISSLVAWPIYSGDYSGKRYSALKQVNRSNVQHLELAWMTTPQL
jgi:alcohol dehydrogenase (cytochrome c)